MPAGQQNRNRLRPRNVALLFLGVEILGGGLLSLFAYGSERVKGALNRARLEVIVIVRKKSKQLEITYYSPQLKALRFEGPNKTVIIQFAKGRGFIIFKNGKRVVREIDFEKFRYADEQAQRYTRDLMGIAVGNGTTHQRKWALLNMSEISTKINFQSCYWASLVNQFKERLAMCVIRDARVRQLAFMKEYFLKIPSQLREVVEDSSELFLYSQGIVPIHWKKKGKLVEVQNYSTETVLPRWFEPPMNLAKEDYGSHYRHLYLKALNISE
jgi:hypothetical protein